MELKEKEYWKEEKIGENQF